MKPIKATAERKNLSGSRNCIRFQWIRLLNVNHEQQNREGRAEGEGKTQGGKLLPTLWWGGLKTSERLMSATVELSMKDKNICKLRHMARGINALQIIPCNLEELMGHSPEIIINNLKFTKSSRHFKFILSLTQSIFWSSLAVRSFSHYTLQLRCATGRNSRSYSPPHPVQHSQEHTKYRDAILFTLFICVFFYL